MSTEPQGSSDYKKRPYSSLKRQAVCEVLDFSSQYGHDQSRSYTVSNVVGEPCNYPNYGDFTQTLVFRTYGKWWHQCPSTQQPFKQSKVSFISHDFVDIKFADPVYPTKIEIYETYNPGAVVRILACKYGGENKIFDSRWFVLWSGDIQECTPEVRIFSPPLKKCPFQTSQLRLEFNQTLLEYYTELDAVLLYGLEAKDEYYNEQEMEKNQGMTIGNLANTLNKQLTLNHYQKDLLNNEDVSFHILHLPSEVINKLLSYLKFPDLGNVAKTCKCFRNYSYDPLWFKEFDLQPYWSKVTDADLQMLSSRCGTTERLKLSWCGPGGLISSAGFSGFGNLYNTELEEIQIIHQAIAEIDLSSCVELPSEAFHELSSLTCLTRLNLYRTQITDDAFEKITRSCSKLMHINLGGCTRIKNYDKAANSLKFCPNIISLDLWRAKTLSPIGIKTIGDNCPNLEEIDIGWCFSAPSDGSIRYLVHHCPKIKKFFLTAVRSVCDDDLIAISENCKAIEQLDILGTSLVSKNSVERILCECKNIKFFDVSFCSQLDEEWFRKTKARFPNVAFKKSVN